MSLATVTTLRATLAERRAARVERQRVARELAAYTTAADRLELDLIIGRHSAEDAAQVDAILSRQAVAA